MKSADQNNDTITAADLHRLTSKPGVYYVLFDNDSTLRRFDNMESAESFAYDVCSNSDAFLCRFGEDGMLVAVKVFYCIKLEDICFLKKGGMKEYKVLES